MTVSRTLAAAAVRRWCRGSCAGLVAHQDEIDALNVYPVPDRDTGTNLVLTMRAAVAAVEAEPLAGAGAMLRAMARGCVLGARGNSGVILAELVRGLAESVAAAGQWTGADLRAGLRRASDQAYAAVAEPVEGTILTVARAAADAAPGAPAERAQVAGAARAGG